MSGQYTILPGGAGTVQQLSIRQSDVFQCVGLTYIRDEFFLGSFHNSLILLMMLHLKLLEHVDNYVNTPLYLASNLFSINPPLTCQLVSTHVTLNSSA